MNSSVIPTVVEYKDVGGNASFSPTSNTYQKSSHIAARFGGPILSRYLELLKSYSVEYPSLDYKQRLLKLNLLPLTLWLELQDVLLFLHLVKFQL